MLICQQIVERTSDEQVDHKRKINAAHDAQNHHHAQMRLLYDGLSILLRILAPIAPHITHHLWRELAYGDNILNAKWPKVNADALKIQNIELIVQVNGKLRGKITVPIHADQQTIEAQALQHENVLRMIADKTVKKIIVVPGKLVNVVVSL